MARFYGVIGYVDTVDTGTGVYEEQVITERPYRGDVLRNVRKFEGGESVNDNLTLGNEFSIVADGYAYEHFHLMRYLKWMGARWKISSVEVQRPRLILSIGGVYNGPEGGPSQ